MSLTRRRLFTVGGVFVPAAVGLSGTLLPRFIDAAQADPAATPQAPAATPQAPAATPQTSAPSTPPADANLLAELAKPSPGGDVVLGSDKAPVTIYAKIFFHRGNI